MKTRISLNQVFKKGAVGFLSVLAILAIAFPVTGGAYAQVPVPWLIAFPENDAVEGWEWPEGATVYLTINNAPEGFIREATAEVTSWGDPRTYIRFDFAGEDGYDLQVGDLVILTDAFGTSTTHEVQPLSITGVDRDTNIVTGTANNDAFLQVWVHEQSEPPVQPTVIDGIWQADLSDVFDVTYGTSGRAWVIAEGGNATAVDWYVPNPHFTVFPEWEFFDGLDWPNGATVTITVEGKPECTTVRESWGYFFNGNFGEGCNIEVGNVVTFKDGETIRTHTVRNLAITKVNQEDDTITGTSDAGAEVYVWPHATGEQQMVIASPKGKWNVSFAGVYDLKPGDEGRSQILDEMGNATAVDWRVPKPRIVASITEDWFNVQEFSPNTALNFTIYEAQGGKPIWKGTVTTDDYGFTWIYAEGRWDLEPGNYLVVKDGSNSKDLVIEGFTFDVFNLSNGQLIGTAPEPYGRNVWVGIGIENDGWSMDVTTDGTGVWIADFGQPVPGDYQWVAAQIFDDDGDASELRPSTKTLMAGNFYAAWSQTNPEEVIYLSWKGSENLTNPWANPYCAGDVEFFGNSWASENEGAPDFFFGSLVAWGTTGTWTNPVSGEIDIGSISSGCPGSADIPIHTNYQFFDDEQHANLIRVERTFEFGETSYVHDVRSFIPRLYPADGFTQVMHPNANGTELVSDGTCGYGCMAADWDESWFAIHNPTTGLGMIVQRASSPYSVALWLDDDGGSFTNASSFLLLQPDGGFTGTVAETEYLCFYDNGTWTPSLELPEGCHP